MRKGFAVASCLLSLVLISRPLQAQLTTGILNGTITDDSGGILPGVSVTLKGEAVVGGQTVTSNSQGFYRFAALPPGAYTITFTLSGMATVRRETHVPLGRTIEENVTMKVSQLAEEVTVQAQAPVVDTQTNEVGTNYDKDWVRNAPVARYSFFDFINAAPGVNQTQTGSAVSTTFGSGTTDNSYQLDGTDFTAPSIGEAWPYPNTDAIEEVEILSLGAPAEYGNVLGAVFNVVTRQGTNTFHGDANFYLQTQGLTSNNTNFLLTPPSGMLVRADNCGTDANGNALNCPFHRYSFDDLTLQLDGPIIKDKLWFFGSYQYQKDIKALAGTLVSEEKFAQYNKSDRMFIKLNYQISPKHKLMFAYHDDFYNLSCVSSVACNSLQAPTSETLDHGHNPSPNITYTYLASDKTFFEARVAGFYGHDHGDPIPAGEQELQPRYFESTTGATSGGIYQIYDGTVSRTSVSAKVSHFADQFLGGSHDFKFGVQFNTGGSDYNRRNNDYIYTYNGVPYGGVTQAFHASGGHETTIGGFFDDSFRVNSRLTLNLGVRYDNARGSYNAQPVLDAQGNPTGQTVPGSNDVFTWNTVSPRFGFSYKVTPDGKTAFKGHYGRYYRGVITSEFETAGPSVPPHFNFSGTYDAQGNPIGLTPAASGSLSVDRNLKAPHTDQFIVQFEREIIPDLGVSLGYIRKDGHDYASYQDLTGQFARVPYVDPFSGQSFLVNSIQSDPTLSAWQLTNPSQMHSKYEGGTFQVTKRMSHHWEMVGSVVISKASGRLPSSLGGPADEPTAALLSGFLYEQSFGQNPNDFINTDGLLISDRPFTGKLQLVTELPWGILAALNFTSQSGRPWAPLILLPSTVTNVGFGASGSILLSAPLTGNDIHYTDATGASRTIPGRVGTWNILDMRLQKSFPLNQSGAKLSVFADFLNLTNDHANDDVGSRVGTDSGFGVPVSFVLPRRLMLGAKFTF